jgi:hypothetical protein
LAHENGAIESSHGHLKKAVKDALLMRGVNDFEDLTSYRRFIDEIVSRKNATNGKRIEAERPVLQSLPGQRTCDYDRHHYFFGWLHAPQGVLHGAVAAHRAPAAGPAL